MNLFTFVEQTDGLENSLNFAIKFGLLPDRKPRDCIKCGKVKGLRCTKNVRCTYIPFMYVCHVRECRATISLGRNTIFDHLPFPLPNALRLIYLWLMKVSVQDCADQLQLTESDVVEWFQIFREVCAFVIINYTEAIGGPGCIVDLCEFQLQTKEESYDLWILTGIDRNKGNNFAIHIEDLHSGTIWPVLKNYILPGSIVVTSRFKEFMNMEKNSKSEQLVFVHPKSYLRAPEDLHLDGMLNDLKLFVEREIQSDSENCAELYAYQYLYFKRDLFCNKPTSELILPFLNDVKLVYPGFEKEKHLEFFRKVVK